MCHHILSQSVTGFKRSRENAENVEDREATKVPATTSVGFRRGRSNSSSTGTVMHMNLPALSDEYRFYISAKGVNGPELCQTRRQSFRRRKFAVEPVHEDFEEGGVWTVVLCVR